MLETYLTLAENKITKKSNSLVLTGSLIFYLFTLILADGTIIFYAASAFFVLAFLYKRGWPRLTNRYVQIYFVFLIYSLLQIVLGIAVYPSVSLGRVATMMVNFIISILLVNYCDSLHGKIVVEKSFVAFSILLVFYVLITKGSFSIERFGDSAPYLFHLTGVNGEAMNSNNVGQVFYTAIFLLINNYFHGERTKKKKYILLGLFFFFCCAITGSRGSLFFVSGYLVMLYVICGKNIKQKIKRIVFVAALSVAAYFLFMNVGFLYELIGQRIETVLNGSFSKLSYSGTGDENSMYYRMEMIRAGMNEFYKKPVFGWGLFAYSQMDYVGSYTHNNFVEMLVSSGIVGFVFYYLCHTFLFYHSFKKAILSKRILFYSLAFFITMKLILNYAEVEYVNRISLFAYAYMASFFDKHSKSIFING